MKYTDEELVALAKSDPKYKNDLLKQLDGEVIKKCVSQYISKKKNASGNGFFSTLEDHRDEMEQVARETVEKILESYDESKSTKFSTYAWTCINRRLIDWTRSQRTKKQDPINSGLPIFGSAEDENGDVHPDLLVNEATPETEFIENEGEEKLKSIIKTSLKPLEIEIFAMFEEKKSYSEIAAAINKDKKYVDNAIQRIRKKLKKKIGESETQV